MVGFPFVRMAPGVSLAFVLLVAGSALAIPPEPEPPTGATTEWWAEGNVKTGSGVYVYTRTTLWINITAAKLQLIGDDVASVEHLEVQEGNGTRSTALTGNDTVAISGLAGEQFWHVWYVSFDAGRFAMDASFKPDGNQSTPWSQWIWKDAMRGYAFSHAGTIFGDKHCDPALHQRDEDTCCWHGYDRVTTWRHNTTWEPEGEGIRIHTTVASDFGGNDVLRDHGIQLSHARICEDGNPDAPCPPPLSPPTRQIKGAVPGEPASASFWVALPRNGSHHPVESQAIALEHEATYPGDPALEMDVCYWSKTFGWVNDTIQEIKRSKYVHLPRCSAAEAHPDPVLQSEPYVWTGPSGYPVGYGMPAALPDFESVWPLVEQRAAYLANGLPWMQEPIQPSKPPVPAAPPFEDVDPAPTQDVPAAPVAAIGLLVIALAARRR